MVCVTCDDDNRRWSVDVETGQCAQCLYEERLAKLVEQTWVDEGTPQFAAADAACDAAVAAGPAAIDDEIWAKAKQRGDKRAC